ncbi:ABC transporter permease [Bacteroidota bacterium]
MIKNYIRIAIRNIFRNKVSSSINIFGLSVGIASALLVLLYVANELSYDRFYSHSDRVYRLAIEALIGDTEIHQTHSSAATYTKLREDFPEVENGVKLFTMGMVPVIKDEQTIYQNSVFLADSVFFEVFPVPLIINNDNLLNRPNTIVLSETAAVKYFGTAANAAGKNLEMAFPYGIGNLDFEVTGVFEDFPANSHFHPEMVYSGTTLPDLINEQGWTANNFITYLLLKEGTDPDHFDEKLKEFTRENMGMEEFDAWVDQGNHWTYFLQPLTSIHLHSDLNGELEPNGNHTYVLLFSIIAIFILLIASINFMNLTTARSSVRAKEVGVRKVYGAQRKYLINQFIGESMVISFISILVGLLIAWLVLPVYNNIVDRELSISMINPYLVLASIIGLGLFLGLFSGIYPSFVLSSFKVVDVLKGKTGNLKSGLAMRRILVIIQFSIAIVLLIGTFTVIRQMNYFQNKPLGFVKEQVLVLENPGQTETGIDAFKEEITKSPDVTYACASNTLPGRSFSNIGFGAEGVEESFTLNIGRCDYDFQHALGLKISKGRFFSEEFPSDSSAAVINSAAAKLLGWEDDPLDRKINNWSGNRGNFHVIGVVENFHYESLHGEIRPMALFLNGGYYSKRDSYIALKINTGNTSALLDQVEKIWKQTTGLPFEYFFLDEDYDNQYANETQTRKIFTFFSIISIVIACLGLFGLASFVSLQRTREIGIRKVMGSDSAGIVVQLNKQFLMWVIISNIVAWPVGWYFMRSWLQNFAFRTDLPVWVFITAGCMSLLVATMIVSAQTTWAAMRNPVEALRYE